MFKYIFSSNFSLFKALFSDKPRLNKREQYYAEILKVLFFMLISGIIFSFLNIGYLALLEMFNINISTSSDATIISNSLSSNLIMILSYIITYYLCFYRTRSNITEYQPQESSVKNKKKGVLCLIGFGFAMFGNLVSGLICTVLQYITSIFENDFSKYIQKSITGGTLNYDIKSLDLYSLIVLFIVMVIIPPIVEELIFRKLFYDRLVRFSSATAVYLITILFAFSHGNIQQIIFAMFAGFGFMIVRRYAGSIKYSTLTHLCVNSAAYCSQIILNNQYQDIVLCFVILASCIGAFLLIKDQDYKELLHLEKFKMEGE